MTRSAADPIPLATQIVEAEPHLTPPARLRDLPPTADGASASREPPDESLPGERPRPRRSARHGKGEPLSERNGRAQEFAPTSARRLAYVHAVSDLDVERLQASLNRFTNRRLENVAPLIVDGEKGFLTNRRIMTVKRYLGYLGERDGSVTSEFVRRMRHPRDPRWSSPRQVVRGIGRRRRQRRRAIEDLDPRPGVSRFDGRPVATWMRGYLVWAREQGWRGQLISGWRSPEHSEQLCFEICGRPTCPGRCAGRASNHSKKQKPGGAVDVSDFARFGGLMERSPFRPRIFNALGPVDPGHFSATGR